MTVFHFAVITVGWIHGLSIRSPSSAKIWYFYFNEKWGKSKSDQFGVPSKWRWTNLKNHRKTVDNNGIKSTNRTVFCLWLRIFRLVIHILNLGVVVLKSYPLFALNQWWNKIFIFSVFTKNYDIPNLGAEQLQIFILKIQLFLYLMLPYYYHLFLDFDIIIT